MQNKKLLLQLFPVVAAFILFLMIFIYVVGLSFSPQKSQEKTVQPTITPIKSAVTAYSHVQYDQTSVDRMLTILRNRQTLAVTDQQTKEQLITTSTTNNGVVYKTTNFTIEYIPSADEFLTEIRLSNIKAAKQEVTGWLNLQGLSNDGICHLPLVFYLGEKAREQLNIDNAAFNPLPDFCE